MIETTQTTTRRIISEGVVSLEVKEEFARWPDEWAARALLFKPVVSTNEDKRSVERAAMPHSFLSSDSASLLAVELADIPAQTAEG